MLVLTRAQEQDVVVCDNQWREIVRVRVTHAPNKVRLGFKAGPQYKLLRSEIYDTPEFRAEHGLPPCP